MTVERQILESTYDAKCTIKKMDKVKIDGETTSQEVIVTQNQPCALSNGSNPSAKQGQVNTDVSNTVKLFIAPEIEILPGSKIEVKQYGKTYELEASGLPFLYPTHQEINLIEARKA